MMKKFAYVFVERCEKQAKATGFTLPAYILLWMTNFVPAGRDLSNVTMTISRQTLSRVKAVFTGFPSLITMNDDFGRDFTIRSEPTPAGTYIIIVEWPYVYRTVVEHEPLPPYLSEVPSGPAVDYSDDDDPPPLVEWESSPSHTEITPPILKQIDDEESLPPLEDAESSVAETAEAILTILFKHSVLNERCAIIASVLGCHRTDLVDRLTQCVIDTAKFPEAELRLALALRLLEKSYE